MLSMLTSQSPSFPIKFPLPLLSFLRGIYLLHALTLPPFSHSTGAYFHQYPATYIIRIQLASSNRQHSLEDTSIPWDAPWLELGRLDFPIQESYSDPRRVWFEETIATSPWNGLEAHRPLGSLGRARERAYERSRRVRAERNVEVVRLDVEVDEIPD